MGVATISLQVYRPYRATAHDMCRFHAEDYIDFLQRFVSSPLPLLRSPSLIIVVVVVIIVVVVVVVVVIHLWCCVRVTPQNISGFTNCLSRFNVGDDW